MPGFVAVALLGTLFAGTSWGAHSTQLLVGYDPANADAAHLAIKAAGGEVRRSSPELGFAVVHASDPDSFSRLAAASPHVHYVEMDDGTRLDGAQWNGAQWNGAQWNGAQWNGAQWNGAQWNGAQWNDAELKDVSEAQRRAAKWTEYHFEYTTSVRMRWAGDMTDPAFVWQWGSWATRAPDAYMAMGTGTGLTTVCVLDSGVDETHGDIQPNFLAAYNAMDPAASARDDAGHGTHVAGIAAGALANGWGVGGVTNARILSVKVLDAQGRGHESDLAFGLVHCASQGARVAIMALSVTEGTHPTLVRALEYAAARDVFLMASVGNAGPCSDCVAFPAKDPRVFGVAAIDGKLHAASFSSQGAEVDVAAPGVAMIGPLPNGGFAFGSGTSQAVAYAGGLALRVRDAAPTLTAPQVADLLRATATDVGAPGVDAATGAGLVHVEAALQAATSR